MKKILLLLCFITLANFSKAQIDSALAAQLQGVLNSRVATGGDHGVSAHLILDNGQSWNGTAGVDALNNPMTDTTVFIAASISKLNIATLLLLFQEDGLIDLDDTWHHYLPGLNVAIDTNITIRQLLNHTSGIADYLEVPANQHYVTDDFSHYYTPQYILENIVSPIPDFPAGTYFNYSNSNYCLAAYVAEAATPNPIQTELRTRIWDQVGMNHTYLGAYEPINDPRAGVYWNFGSGLNNYSNQSDTAMLSFGFGTDNVVTCPTDLAKLTHAILSNQLLDPQSMTEMQTFVPESFSNIQWVAGYGLGLHHLLGQNVDTVLGHNGKFCNNSDVFHSSMCGFTLATMSNTETLWQGIYNPMYNVLRNYFQCNSVPVANFHPSQKIACTGTTIIFNDSSTNIRPTIWNWSFPGGTLTDGTSVTDSMPHVLYNNPGTYAVSYIASTSAGSDSITKNGYITINSNAIIYNSAFVEDFETASIPNSDWSLSNDGGSDWEVTSMAAASGSKSMYIDNFTNIAGNKSRLFSTTFDISGFSSPKLTFKMAYQQKASTNLDKFQILTSTNCGNTWSIRYSKIGTSLATVTPPSSTPLVPTAGQFTTYTVSLGSVATSTNLRFKFEFTADPNGPGNNIFIDDINIFGSTVGIQNNETQMGLSVYPNPSSGNVNIEFSSNEKQNVSVIVTDIVGRTIESIPSKQYASGQSHIVIAEKTVYQRGIYFVNVNINGTIISKKIVIQ